MLIKKRKIPIILFLSIAVFSLYSGRDVASGEKKPSLSGEKEKLKSLDKKAKKSKELILRQEEKERSIMKELNKIDRSLDKREKELAIYESNLAQNQKKKERTKLEIRELEKEIERSLDHLKGRLRAIYKSGGMGMIRVIFSSRSISDLLQSMAMMRYIARQDTGILDALREKSNVCRKKSEELEQYERRIKLYKERAIKEKESLEKQKKERRALLDSVRKDKTRQVALLKDLEKRSEALRKRIENWASGSASSGDFPKMKGSLIWPVMGKVLIPFGLQHDSGLDRKILNNGIDIRASFGSDILSVGSGKVLYAGWFLGYGKLVIIDHGKGYSSIYAHASEIFVREGQSVKAGDRIAAVGDTDSIRGPELYFEIRYKGRPQDPFLWLGERQQKTKVVKEKGLP
ncbi:MAG: murein hydrolase activator EnvC family protein [bacterium]